MTVNFWVRPEKILAAPRVALKGMKETAGRVVAVVVVLVEDRTT